MKNKNDYFDDFIDMLRSDVIHKIKNGRKMLSTY